MPWRVVSLLVLAVPIACGGGSDLGRGAQTTLASSESHPSKPPEARTVDSAGYVDNAGNTSEETVPRPETSGVRGTETGSDRPTGTNTGLPIAVPGRAPKANGKEKPMAPRSAALQPQSGGTSPVASYEDAPGKLGRAMCDHESACERIGPGRAWETDDACVFAMRERAMADIDAAGCAVDAAAVTLCLTAVRRAPCDTVIDRAAALQACAASEICARPRAR
jgi:hypothetical protein